MRKFAFAAIAVSLMFTSCKKDESSGPGTPSVAPAAYYPLKTGNYWIYENWKIDTNGVETNLNVTDSVFVSGTGVVNGKTYAVIESEISVNPGLTGLFRDSANYLVDTTGNIRFAPGDFADPLETDILILGGDTIYSGTSRMEKVKNAITVPAGNFNVLLNRWIYEIKADVPVKYQELLEYRAPGVGVVIRQVSNLKDPDIVESRLVRYHIN